MQILRNYDMYFVISQWMDKTIVTGILGTELQCSTSLFTPNYPMNYLIELATK